MSWTVLALPVVFPGKAKYQSPCCLPPDVFTSGVRSKPLAVLQNPGCWRISALCQPPCVQHAERCIRTRQRIVNPSRSAFFHLMAELKRLLTFIDGRTKSDTALPFAAGMFSSLGRAAVLGWFGEFTTACLKEAKGSARQRA